MRKEGGFEMLRIILLFFRIQTYPTFIVERKEIYTGWDKSQLEGLLGKYIKASLLLKHRSIQPRLS